MVKYIVMTKTNDNVDSQITVDAQSFIDAAVAAITHWHKYHHLLYSRDNLNLYVKNMKTQVMQELTFKKDGDYYYLV